MTYWFSSSLLNERSKAANVPCLLVLGARARLYNGEPKEVADYLPFPIMEDQDNFERGADDKDVCLVLARVLQLGILEVSEHVIISVRVVAWSPGLTIQTQSLLFSRRLFGTLQPCMRSILNSNLSVLISWDSSGTV